MSAWGRGFGLRGGLIVSERVVVVGVIWREESLERRELWPVELEPEV